MEQNPQANINDFKIQYDYRDISLAQETGYKDGFNDCKQKLLKYLESFNVEDDYAVIRIESLLDKVREL